MARYTKHNSNYIKTEKHQSLKDGSTIFERDWVTIGSQFHFGPGKRVVYNNGNFLFTTSPVLHYYKKFRKGIYLGEYNYDDVKNSTSQINTITNYGYNEDIRTYAYYGSCFELLRISVENIIKTFPGNISVSEQQIEYLTKNELGEDVFQKLNGYYVLNNQFDINLHLSDVQLNKNDNELRYLAQSWGKYQVSDDYGRVFKSIKSYNVTLRSLYEQNVGDVRYFQYLSDEEAKEVSDWHKSECTLSEWIPNSEEIHLPVYSIDIEYVDNEQTNTTKSVTIEAYIFNSSIIHLVKEIYEKVVIQPNEEVIETYFQNLKGFEKHLLNRSSNPLYSNVFITPIENDISYDYVKRTYTWPSDGYCINISSNSYHDFIHRMTEMAENFDEVWTDNLWRRMTHEAIKNYDWTYTKEFEEGDEEDNIEGGERMHQVINIIGGVFDEIKSYTDLIKRNNTITYNGDRNIPTALLSDKLELQGWDVYSTIPTYTEENSDQIKINPSEITIDTWFLYFYGINWYNTQNYNEISCADVDIEFMRRLSLSTKNILQAKGTITSIEMVMGLFGYGDGDYEVTEEYRTVTPVGYDYPTSEARETFGEKIERINGIKQYELEYGGGLNGLPIGQLIIPNQIDEENVINETYLIPYYDKNKIYDGYFYFQSKGGWSYRKDINEIEYYVNVDDDNDIITAEEYEQLSLQGKVDYEPDNDWDPNSQTLWINLDSDKRSDIITDSVYQELPISTKLCYEEYQLFGSSYWVKNTNDGFKHFLTNTAYYEEYTSQGTQTDEYVHHTPQNPVWYVKYDDESTKISKDRYEELEEKFDYVPYIPDDVYYEHTIWVNTETGKEIDYQTYQATPESEKIQYVMNDSMEIPYWINKYNKTEISIPYETYSQLSEYGKNKYRLTLNPYKWDETISYLHVVPNIDELLNVNSFTVSKGDIYYIVDVTNYSQYKAIDTLYSHFFVLKDDFAPQTFASWESLNLEADKTDKNYHYVLKAKYLDSIIPYNGGNNPHIGFGKYDMGEQFFEYLSTPFKYSIDNKDFEPDLEDEAKGITFNITEPIETYLKSDKVKIFDSDDIEIEEINGINYGGKFNLSYRAYNRNSIIEKQRENYYLNTKVIHIKNKLDNNFYRKYFNNVIMKYLVQVIPSTAILVLEGFDEVENQNEN